MRSVKALCLVGCSVACLSVVGCSYEQKTFAEAQDIVRTDMMSTAARGIVYVGSDEECHYFIWKGMLGSIKRFKVAKAQMAIGGQEFPFSRFSSQETSQAGQWFKVELPKPTQGFYRVENGEFRRTEGFPLKRDRVLLSEPSPTH